MLYRVLSCSVKLGDRLFDHVIDIVWVDNIRFDIFQCFQWRQAVCVTTGWLQYRRER